MEPEGESSKENVRRLMHLYFMLILLPRDGPWRLETTARSLLVFSEILTWMQREDLKSQRKRLKPEGLRSRGEKRREGVGGVVRESLQDLV